MTWRDLFPPKGRRIDETPVRHASEIVRPAITPATPTAAGDVAPLHIIPTSSVGQGKFAGRWQRFLKLAQASGVDGYLADVLPVVPLSQFAAEDYFPDEALYTAADTVAAGGVGNFSASSLNNPAGSGVLVIVTAIIPQSGATALNFQLGGDAAVAITLLGSQRDGRIGAWLAVGASKGGLSKHNGTVTQFANGPFGQKVALPNTSVEWVSLNEFGLYVLAPGQALTCVPAQSNQGLSIEWRWRERPA